MKILEIVKILSFIAPDFDEEWNEVKFSNELYSYFKTKKNWLKIAQSGKETTLSKADLEKLSNHETNVDNLEDEKVERVAKLLNAGSIELPIVVKDGNFIRLLSGNTRLALLKKHKLGLKVWLIQTPDIENYF